MGRPYRNAHDYYGDHEKGWRDPQTIAMFALIDVLIDHRRAIEAEGEETREEIRRLAREGSD